MREFTVLSGCWILSGRRLGALYIGAPDSPVGEAKQSLEIAPRRKAIRKIRGRMCRKPIYQHFTWGLTAGGCLIEDWSINNHFIVCNVDFHHLWPMHGMQPSAPPPPFLLNPNTPVRGSVHY